MLLSLPLRPMQVVSPLILVSNCLAWPTFSYGLCVCKFSWAPSILAIMKQIGQKPLLQRTTLFCTIWTSCTKRWSLTRPTLRLVMSSWWKGTAPILLVPIFCRCRRLQLKSLANVTIMSSVHTRNLVDYWLPRRKALSRKP